MRAVNLHREKVFKGHPRAVKEAERPERNMALLELVRKGIPSCLTDSLVWQTTGAEKYWKRIKRKLNAFNYIKRAHGTNQIASRSRTPKRKETHSVSKNAPPGEKKWNWKLSFFLNLPGLWKTVNFFSFTYLRNWHLKKKICFCTRSMHKLVKEKL